MDDTIYREDALSELRDWRDACVENGHMESASDLKNVIRAFEELLSAKSVDKDINVPDNDTISRQGAIKAFCERCGNLGEPCDGCNDIPLLYSLPSAQPERKKGKWIYGEHDIAMCDGYFCDQCGFFVPWDYKHKSIDFIKDYHWCPSCGADMRGEEDG